MALPATGSIQMTVLDEIGLEGLEGITIAGLWIRLSDTLNIPLPINDALQNQVWKFILSSKEYLEFYLLPNPREKLKIWDRFSVTDPDYGLPYALTECPFTLYKNVPISDGVNLGSCENYKERIPIPFEEIEKMSISDIDERWSDNFIIVGTQQLRFNCLIPPSIPIPSEITLTQYCLLEYIGRSRQNGVTSAGKFSVLHCCRDSAIAFYVKNKLVRLGLVIKQAHTEKRGDRLMPGTILCLTRFFARRKTAFHSVIVKMFRSLKTAPQQRMPLITLRALFPPENQNLIKKLMLTHFFRKFFETTTCVANELPVQYRPPKGNLNREVVCLKLKKPDQTEEDLFNDDDEEPEKETKHFYDYEHTYFGMPLMEQVYRSIHKFGRTGCSQSLVCQMLSLHNMNVRQIVKKALKEKIITSYRKDIGRQRTNMLVSSNCYNTIVKAKEDTINISMNLKCDDEPKLPRIPDPPLKDIPIIKAAVELTSDTNTELSRDNTAKQVERMQKIVEIVNENCIMQIPILRHELVKYEQELGYKDEICNKSLYKTISRLHNAGIVNMYQITLNLEKQQRVHRYITHPKITLDHYVLAHEIIKLKTSMFLYNFENRKIRTDTVSACKDEPMEKERIGLIPIGQQKAPKFLTARLFHEFLFYMLHGLESSQRPFLLTEGLLKSWVQNHPDMIDISEMYHTMSEEFIVPYTTEISWRTFIPPLPPYDDKPFGWVALPDVVHRLPFSLLHKIIRIAPGVDPEILEFMAHPVRQHYLIKQLPIYLQGLINRSRLSRIIMNIIGLLNKMGLVQISEKGGKNILQFWLYINHNATVVDTTQSEPGYIKINPERDYPEIKFTFNTILDIQQYWSNLHKICVQTQLGFVHKNPSKTPAKILYKIRRTQLDLIVKPITNFNDAPNLDTGIPPGDGLGAGGLASSLYSSFHRNWTWLVNTKHTAAAIAAAQKLKKCTKYTRSKLAKLISKTGSKQNSNQSINAAIKKVNRFTITSARKIAKRKAAGQKRKHNFSVDAIDRDALKHMRSLRARWTMREDYVLKMVRAVLLFLAIPVVHFSYRDAAMIARDLIRKQCSIYNKTTQACHRRIQFLIKTNRHLPELPTWLHALQTDEVLYAQYGTNKFFIDLKTKYPKKTDLHNALFVHFLKVYTHLQTILVKLETYDKQNLLITFPKTLTEFYRKYRECSPLNESEILLYLNPTSVRELQQATANNVLHSSLCCINDKTQYNLQVFEIFKTYPEDTLHATFKKARADGLVVARKKGAEKGFNAMQLSGPSFTFSNKFRMSLIYQKIPYMVYDMYHSFFEQAMKSIFGPDSSGIEIKSPHSAQLFFIAELLSKNIISIAITPPTSMLTVDPTAQQSNLERTSRILDHYHTALDNAPQTDYLRQFNAVGQLTTRVKFKAANEKYKLHYHPFDVIAKLNPVNIHFFCFLDNLSQSLDSTFNENDNKQDRFCPFDDCILDNSHYLEAIDRILIDKEDCLAKIKDNLHTKRCVFNNSITLCVDNFSAVFERFVNYVNNKMAKAEKKDIGKVLIKRNPVDMIALCMDILKYDDDIIFDDEFEPTLNKEERIAKAQDVFVVNLPTLRITTRKEPFPETDLVTYKGVLIPEILVQTAIQRNEIFEKIFEEVRWTYTNNSLETLKPIMDQKGITRRDQRRIMLIHDYIASQALGAHASDLVERFSDIAFLQKAIKLLRQHFLVLRSGVSTFMYVHKNHVRNWLIHTRHIKRLERESLGRLVPSTSSSSQKRTYVEVEPDASEPSPKSLKASSDGRRIPKPVVRYEDDVEKTTSHLDLVNDADLLAIKPCAWIRVDGTLNRRVLDKWLACLAIECISRNGCTVHSLCLRFKQMHSVDVMFLLELLVDMKIISLQSFHRPKVSLFSSYQLDIPGEGGEFTDPTKTFIITASDAISRMTKFIGDKQYKVDFIC